MISNRAQVDPFMVMDILAEANRREAQGQSIIHMEIGQPSTPAPTKARSALAHQLDDPLGYSLALGRDDLRSAIAKKYADDYSLDISAERIILTTGSSAAFQLAFIALFDADQRVGIAQPGYPSYRNILRALSLEAVGIETRLENGFQPTPNEIRNANLDGLLIASPANPTGTLLGEKSLRALIAECHGLGIPFISDEIYHGLTYGQSAVSALEISDDLIVINSFSKYYSMTGWRLGWMVVPEDMVRSFERLAQNLYICPPHASQIAALGALDADDECQRNLAVYAANRELLIQALPALDLSKFAPADGGFYFYIDVTAHCEDSRGLIETWLDYGVAATPGWDFDPTNGGQFIRLSYAGSTQQVQEAILRLKSWHRDHVQPKNKG